MQQLKIMQSVTKRTMTLDRYLKDISPLPMISPEEESVLAGAIRNGDEKALSRLVEANLRFVVSVAKQYQNRGLELCDLINEGNMGLIKAALKFDPTRGFKFISYAIWWIRQSILAAISEQGRIVRLPQNQVGVISKISREKMRFLQENCREPSDEELAECLDMDPSKVAEARSNSHSHLSFDTPIGEDEDASLLDIIPDTSVQRTDARMDRESLHEDICTALMILPQRERDVISLAFGIGCPEMTLEEIGQRMDLTRERVRQIKEKAIRKLGRDQIVKRLVQYR